MSKPAHTALVKEAFVGLEFELPSGKRIQAKPLKLGDAVRFLDILTEFELDPLAKKAKETLGVVVQEFPAAVGLKAEDFEGLTLGEFCDLVKRFFHHRRENATPSSTSSPEISLVPAAGAGGAGGVSTSPASSS